MFIRFFPFFSAISLNTVEIAVALFTSTACAAPSPVVSPQALANEIAKHRVRVPEFEFIREQAKALGIRVWLFGGTAAGYGHYAKWDLQRQNGDTRFQADRFDYDYTNIYRSTQDADLVVDGSEASAKILSEALAQTFPHLQGSKSAWEVRLLKQSLGTKEALLDNPDYLNQHTDSNSTGMIELTDPIPGESVVRDLRDWRSHEPIFLKDLAEGQVHYYFSERHQKTQRAIAGNNPEIFSVVRLLTKAFQYELALRPEDIEKVREVVRRFDPARDLTTPYSRSWMEKNGKKLIQHAVNIEYAWDTLERFGLRRKLIALKNDPGTEDSLAWWLSREPLRNRSLGTTGRTAHEVFSTAQSSTGGAKPPIVLAHETNSFLSLESITRAHTGDPNVLISRDGRAGEYAHHGDGFYTRIGRIGGRNTGRTIRFTLHPEAREGPDFKLAGTDFILIHNKRAIRVIPESLNLNLVDYFQMLKDGKSIDASDLGLLEKLKRRLNSKIHIQSREELNEIFSLIEENVDTQKDLPNPLISGFFSLSPEKWDRARVETIVDRIITKNTPNSVRFVANHILNQEWSANRPDWCERVLRSKVHLREPFTPHMHILEVPHWRHQVQLVRLAVEHDPDPDTLFQYVILRYWRDRPEFSELTQSLMKRSYRVAIEVNRQILKKEQFANRLDLVETYLRTWSKDDSDIFRTLALPHWRDQAKVIQLIIDADMRAAYWFKDILINHWIKRPEFSHFISAMLRNGSKNYHEVILESVLADPKLPANADYLRAILEGRKVHPSNLVDKVLTLPHWHSHPEYSSLVTRILNDSDSLTYNSVAFKILNQASSTAHPEWVAALIERSPKWEWIYGHVLSLPHWMKHQEYPTLLRKLMERAEPSPHAQGLQAFHEALKSPEWADARYRSRAKSRAFEMLATRAHEIDSVGLFRLILNHSEGEDFSRLVDHVNSLDRQLDTTPRTTMVVSLLDNGSRGVTKLVAEKILTQPWSSEHPEWIERVARHIEVGPAWVKKNLLNLPHYHRLGSNSFPLMHWRKNELNLPRWDPKRLNLPGPLNSCLIEIKRILRKVSPTKL